MKIHTVKVYPSKIKLNKKNQLAWKLAEISSDNVKLNKKSVEMAINRIIDNASVAIASLNKKRFNKYDLPTLLNPLSSGKNIGILSEVGLPAIADPGNLAVRYAHQQEFEVVCLEGASSIILGLASSGLNGQKFTFLKEIRKSQVS